MEDHHHDDLYVEVEVGGGLSSARKAARAEKVRGFDTARALGGIRSAGSGEGSACTTRGDGLFQNGTNFLREGNKVQIGPAAFTEENIEETMRVLQSYDAFGGSKRQPPEMSSEPVQEGPRPRPSPAPTSLQQVDLGIIRDLESVLSLSDRASRSRGLDGTVGSAVYDISDGGLEDERDSCRGAAELTQPRHKVKWVPSELAPAKLELRVEMPLVSSSAEVSLAVLDSKRGGRVLMVASKEHGYRLEVSQHSPP